jgi:AcrR family transcriptional regulator
MQAAAELTIERGDPFATIQRITQRADTAPRTVSTWFPAKDYILFERVDEQIASGLRHLQSEHGDVIDRMQAWFREEVKGSSPTPTSHGCRSAQSPTTPNREPATANTSTTSRRRPPSRSHATTACPCRAWARMLPSPSR